MKLKLIQDKTIVISELIKFLELVKMNCGDIEVYHSDVDYGDVPTCSVVVRHNTYEERGMFNTPVPKKRIVILS